MTEKKSQRPFAKYSIEDMNWLRYEPISVHILWMDSAESDPYGNKWQPLITTVTGSTFRAARRKIEEYGAVKFRRDDSGDWEVLNLHGAYTDYWGGNGLSRYQEFLNSDYWQDVRQLVLARDNHTCQGCGVTTNLHVHHMTYEHHGSEHEHLDDLITLCEVCHCKVHGLKD